MVNIYKMGIIRHYLLPNSTSLKPKYQRLYLPPQLCVGIYQPFRYWQGVTQGKFLSKIWIQSFPCFRLVAKKKKDKRTQLCLNYRKSWVLLLRRTNGFMPFPRIFALSEIQTVSFGIWTRVVDSISYDDNLDAKYVPISIRFVYTIRHKN